MTLPLAAREAAADRPRRRSFEPVMTLTGEGLVLGGAILAPLCNDRDEGPEIAIDGAEERILALLAVAYGKTAQPGVLGNIRRAARYWQRGEDDLAAIEIALSGLPPLPDAEGGFRALASRRRTPGGGPCPVRTDQGVRPRPHCVGFFEGRVQPRSAARSCWQSRRRPMDLRRNSVRRSRRRRRFVDAARRPAVERNRRKVCSRGQSGRSQCRVRVLHARERIAEQRCCRQDAGWQDDRGSGLGDEKLDGAAGCRFSEGVRGRQVNRPAIVFRTICAPMLR
jgi:hypothetical protein